MSDMKIIKEIIKPSAIISPQKNQYNKFHVKLTELQVRDCIVTITNIPHDAIIIKVDTFTSPGAIFSGTKGECKRADYVIIAEKEHKKFIVYIELKKTKGHFNEIVQQLYGAMCFIHYFQEIGRHFWKTKNFLKDYQPRFVTIGHISIDKQPTLIHHQKDKHDTPEKPLQISWPNRQLQFNKLIGKN